MTKENILPRVLLLLLTILVPFRATFADPRIATVAMICGPPGANATLYVPNFVGSMENITTKIRTFGYSTAVTGTGPTINFALSQCYRDLSSTDCMLCYAQLRTVLPQCFPSIGGRLFLDGCYLRAEIHEFFGQYVGPSDRAVCGNRTRRGDSGFRVAVRQALSRAIVVAASNDGYARVEERIAPFHNESVFVSADCWRTVNASSCRICLENAYASLSGCLPWSEGKAVNTGCFVRYSDFDFLNPVPGKGSSRGTVIIITSVLVGAATVLLIGAVIGRYLWKQRVIQKKRKGSGDTKKLVKTLTKSGLNFKYSALEVATSKFDEAKKLGQGGFGTVYKGVLADGREIAVKRLFFNNKHRIVDFYNEVKIVSSVEHKNLLRLLGCSCSGPESLLVYEFLPNKSLDYFIFDATKGKELNWEKRFEIIIGTTEGLIYLHENTRARIIHRDIKASNILLDSRFQPKIADFGLARSFQDDKSHISTAIAGTLGYMAPEYFTHGQLTEKADVYSFGVLVLEIISGRKNNQSDHEEHRDTLITIVWKHFQLRTVEEIIDPNLIANNYQRNNNIKDEIVRAVHVGLLCTQEVSSRRPSMSRVLQMLVNKEEDLPVPSNPPFLNENTMELHGVAENNGSSDVAWIASISGSTFSPR
ncbi:cysteine-rich receptor-like protein kinase 2 [Andrographis paniculata]|uniref:cysteine-rich receptor-like protein kinase 2 n=1 Tax=Andrographis paniculata TaxID=175694 RepID=UPI0021E86EE1|nr:cysteine-rich receptor-like protein kinase 2 [Andrographis paniculata]